MSNTITIDLHNNETALPKGKRMLLGFEHPALVPCTVTEGTEDFTLTFDVEGLKSLAEKKDYARVDRYRLLYNCAELHCLTDEFTVSLSPDNVYLDINLKPRILRRDVGKTSDEVFLAEYKALIGCVLDPKYSFEDYNKGGKDLYKRRSLKAICRKETLEEIQTALLERYEQERTYIENNMTSINRKRLRRYRVMAPILLTVAALCAALAVYLYFFKLPFAQKLIDGNSAYLSSDYLSVQEAMEGIEVSRLPAESKYILARSYVISEGLNSAQKENILSMLTPKTDAIYYDYWIELGRLNFESAIDVAQRIGDDQLLLLAYIKYEAFLETDTYSLSGDEKAEKIQSLRDKIEKMSGELEKERESAAEESAPTPMPTPVIESPEDPDAAAETAESENPEASETGEDETGESQEA